MKDILIVKFGALGDVLRTSYFINALSKKYTIHWLTSTSAESILRPYDSIIKLYTSFSLVSNLKFDIVFSLDDEFEIIFQVCQLTYDKIIGFYLNEENLIVYSNETSEWNDMGIHSKFGKESADKLKKSNRKTHIEIFSKIFSIHENILPNHPYAPCKKNSNYDSNFKQLKIGLNCFAGKRWPSKSISIYEYHRLVEFLSKSELVSKISLYGEDDVYDLNCSLVNLNSSLHAFNTSSSIKALFDSFFDLDLLITADSLALHIANCCRIPTISFFTSTSPWEIDTTNDSIKMLSLSDDFCSYKPHADNSTITSDRLIQVLHSFINKSV